MNGTLLAVLIVSGFFGLLFVLSWEFERYLRRLALDYEVGADEDPATSPGGLGDGALERGLTDVGANDLPREWLLARSTPDQAA